MKKISLILNFSIIFVLIFLGFKQVQADINIYDIEISNMTNGRATIKWATDTKTRGEIRYGLDADNLNRYMGYSLYDLRHESILSGLEKDQIYYYRIVAFQENNENESTYTQSFSTADMINTDKPQFEEVDILQIVDDGIAISWTTNENTKAKVYYGTNESNLSKSKSFRSFEMDHSAIITGLKSAENYFL
ncbi:fibronectin type III domain-containing protein, partial [bacterium]|nr:fibronectin type III domain-containing protein [bacterium]